jgi:hypothetical protein
VSGKATALTGAASELRNRAAKAVAVFLIFAIVGPPIAALIAIGIIPFFEPGWSIVAENVEDSINGIGRLLSAAYFLGSLQLGVTGFAAALWLFFARRPRVSVILVLLTSFATAVVAVFVLANPMAMPAPDPGIVAAFLVLHVGAAIGCWLVANALLRTWEWRHARMVTP